MVYLFIAGRLPALAKHELETVLSRHQIQHEPIENLASDFLLVKTSQEIEPDLFLELGGFTKFGILRRNLTVFSDAKNLAQEISSLLEKRNFGISFVNSKINAKEIAQQVKNLKKAKRYITAQNKVLTAAQSKGIRQEFLVVGDNQSSEQIQIFEILAVQNIDQFTFRDRFLPEAHGHRGMLPPKLARIMVNLGLENSKKSIIYDPFCGTGRVLMEALLLGQDIIGSDIDKKATVATRKNLDWLVRKFNLLPINNLEEKIFISSISDTASILEGAKVDAIVTEPYLGPPQKSQVSDEERDRIFTLLKPIYLDLFKVGQAILRVDGVMVIVFPVIGGNSLYEKLVDNVADLGYITAYKDIVSRPDQIVGREIIKFKLSK